VQLIGLGTWLFLQAGNFGDYCFKEEKVSELAGILHAPAREDQTTDRAEKRASGSWQFEVTDPAAGLYSSPNSHLPKWQTS
jgi:hypothetical protein